MTKYFLLFLIFQLAICTNAQQSIEQLRIQLSQLQEEKEAQQRIQIVLDDEIEDLKISINQMMMENAGFPIGKNTTIEITKHAAYSLQYNEKHEQSNWVMHVLPIDVISGKFGRSNEFKIDTLVLSGTAEKDDYWFSGFDRGHLAPSADFRWSLRAINESYLYSNISPQRPELNRERWAEMEDLLRSYVTKTKHPLIIVTGPILKDSLAKIGKVNQVSVPEYFYKAAIDLDDSIQSGIAFVMPNKECAYPPLSYAISIDSLEKLTGYDFFPLVNEEKSKKVESAFIASYWQTLVDDGNVLPIAPEDLATGTYNSVQAKFQVGNKVTVCGTVVSTKYSEKSGATFINLDRKFPNQIFSINIWKDDRKNFSYQPEVLLQSQKICATGKISLYQDVPSMAVKNEESIQIIDLQEDDD